MSQAREALGSVKQQMLLLQQTEALLAQADALSKQYEEWTCHRDSVLMSVQRGHASWQRSLLTEQIWAASQPMISYCDHLSWQRSALEKQQTALQHQRLLRSRLARQREQLDQECDQMLREERFQQRAVLSFLERTRAQNQARQGDFMKKSHELFLQLQLQREQRLPSTTCAAVQTDAVGPSTTTPQTFRPQEDSIDSYSQTAFSSESEASDYGDEFDDDSQSSNSSPRESGCSSHGSSNLSGETSQEASEQTHGSSAGGGGGGGGGGATEPRATSPSSSSVTSQISDSWMAGAKAQSVSIGESIKSIGSSIRSSSKSNSSILSESINSAS